MHTLQDMTKDQLMEMLADSLYKKEDTVLTLNDFINIYKDKWEDCCGLVIREDGLITLVEDLHTSVLERTINNYDLIKKNKVDKNYLHRLINYTNTICVWKDYQLSCYNGMTNEQMETLSALSNHQFLRINVESVLDINLAE